MKNKGILILIIFIIPLFSLNTFAKPMPAPSENEAVKSSLIVVAAYKSYKPLGKITYFNPPIAQYKIVRILKGKEEKADINVIYEFHDGSACLEEKDWTFKSDMMPKKESKWILFLYKSDKNEYLTFRGNYGRWQYTNEAMKKVTNLLNNQNIKNSLNN